MSVKRETIILELEDRASAEALAAAGAFKTLDRSINSLSGTVARTGAFKSMGRDVDRMGSSFDRAGSSIDTFSGRVGLLGTGLMAIGPAAIPITAAAVPAIATLAAGMGAAAGAAGVLALAFSGVGDAVSAVSDYRLEPTAANLARVQQAMEELGPAGAQFVMTLDRISPALEDLQQRAGAGIFPGFERGLNQLMTELPGVRDLVSDLSVTVGTLGEASANALTNDADWQEFFAHIANDGAPALESFGRATGNFTAGVANVLEALTGIGGGSASLVETSRAFREWADNLEHTEGFKEFADYIRESGPQVAEFLAATGNAMLGLAEAAAPWGQVVLPALTALADVTAAIASSPLGPPLFAAAAAMLVLNKASALMGPNLAKANIGISTFGSNASRLRTDIGAMSREFSNLGRAQSSALSFFSGTSSAAQRTRASVAEVGKAAAGAAPAIAAVGLLSTGTADKVGLTNTAMLGLAGSMIGPWGAAAGATVGLLVDVAQANDDVLASIQRVDQIAASGGGLEEMNKQLEKAKGELSAFRDEMGQGDADSKIKAAEDDFWGIGGFKAGLDKIKGIFGDSGVEEAEKAFDKAKQKVEDTKAAVEQLGAAITLTAQTPAELATSLTSAFDPAQGLIGAQDAMTTTLSGLKGQLDATNKSLVGNSQAAIDNRAAISAGVDGIQNLNAAQGEAKVGAAEMALTLNEQRQALIDSGAAAGLSRGQVERLVNQMGLTPDVVRTAFEAAGIEGVNAKTQGLINKFRTLPPKVQTKIQAEGIPSTMGQVDALVRKYNLTEKQRQALITLKDNATPGLNKIISTIGRVRGKTVQVKVDPGTSISNVAAVQAAINSLSGKTVTVTTLQKSIYMAGKQSSLEPDANGGFHVNGAKAFADGGYGMDGRYYSRTPQIIPGGANILWGEKETGWEAYISGKPSERNRNLDILAMAADRLGATVTPFANGGTRGRRSDPVAAALWQSGHRDPKASLIADMTGRQLARLGRAFDDLSTKRLDRFGRSIERATDIQEKAVDRVRDQLDSWNQKRDEVRSQVSGSMTRNWFEGGSTDVWSGGLQGGTVAYANQQWQQQGTNADLLHKTIANLVKNGAGDAFIREILGSPDPLAAAQMFNKQSVAGMRHSQSLYLSATKATASAASYTSGVVYGDEIAKATGELQAANKRLAAIEKLLSRNHKEAQHSRDKNSPRKAAAKGSRSAKR